MVNGDLARKDPSSRELVCLNLSPSVVAKDVLVKVDITLHDVSGKQMRDFVQHREEKAVHPGHLGRDADDGCAGRREHKNSVYLACLQRQLDDERNPAFREPGSEVDKIRGIGHLRAKALRKPFKLLTGEHGDG